MSWHCSLELVEAFSQAKVWVTGSCVRWRKIRIAERSLCGGKKTNASQSSQSGTMSTPSTGTPGMALSMSFLLDFHAKDSQLQESKKEQTIPETSGQPQQGLSGKYVQGELFSKTYQESESTFESWPETLPIWGMIVSGELFPLEKPELDILGKDGGAWPTPRAANPGSRVNGKGGKILNEEVLIKEGFRERGVYANKPEWPTPTASEKSGINPKTGRGAGLSKAVKEDNKWPTPRSSEYKGVGPLGSSSHEHRFKKGYLDATVQEHQQETGKLNPDWVEWLMGWPIGWTSLDFINIDYKGWWRYCMTEEPARYWEQDPADIPVGEKYHTPRLTSKKENRAQRLKCCGNGQVPQQLLLAMRVLCQERQTHGLQ